MSNFTYEKFKEIANKIDKINESLKQIDETNYKSFKTLDSACYLISLGNSLNSYIRHSKRTKSENKYENI